MLRFGVLLLLLAQPARCSACPPGCACSEAAQTVKCVSKELRFVPAGIPAYTRNLFITGNRISRLGPGSFAGLDNVTTLSLSNNRISEVASHTFSSLHNLRSLDLSSNQLALIHPEAFAVPGLMLKELNLSRALYNHSSVMDLATSLRWSGLEGLQSLDLSGNGLIYLPPRIFSHLSGLRRLQLANNSIVSIYNETFSGLGQLEELDLSLNALKIFGDEGLAELEHVPGAKLHLGDNPYMCTCGIEPFTAWLNASRVRVVDVERLVCLFPVELRNTSLLAAGSLVLGCHRTGEGDNLALQTSYVFLGIVLGFVGLMFLFVLYLNRKGIKKRVYDMRDACREVWEGYHYRYEIDSDPRLSQVSTTADV
ncbi:trophoblast glycoprotein a [Pygocentrus nattereri]|uniref:Trophoblast glycoprotein a n=1 Tax=Pygocentrus nattereri TaxID=42514 RepID=A0A3B4D583_PYGNA|nr:trophoblast glycoprotein a [Pygocentrus nattereri]